jgi:hypothetical protein
MTTGGGGGDDATEGGSMDVSCYDQSILINRAYLRRRLGLCRDKVVVNLGGHGDGGWSATKQDQIP